MKRWLIALAAAALLLTGCTPPAQPPEPMGSKDAGIQLFQWTWDSIAAECTDVLGPVGIEWVLTSPPQEHILGRTWWTAYQPVSYRVESRLGTRDEFAAMVETCREAGVAIVADAVINHMTGQNTPGTGWAGSPYEHYAYPGIYTPADFHTCTQSPTGDIMDYDDDAEVQQCELVNLADLDTASPSVRSTIVAYLQDLLSLGVAGFRMDAAKHMPADDVAAIVAQLPAGTRILQEIIRGQGEPITPEQYVGNGPVFEFGFARSVKVMVSSGILGQKFGPDFATLPSDEAIVFVTNHDTERNGETLTYADADAYLLGNVFMLAQPYGVPVLYSGYAFESRDAGPAQDGAGAVEDAQCAPEAARYRVGEWVCPQRWPAIQGMLAFRSAVGDAPVTDEWVDGDAYAFGRGAYGFVVLNAGAGEISTTFRTSLAPGVYTDAISGAGVTVAGDRSFTATVPGMTALAIHVGG